MKFIVYERITGEMTYLADALALTHLDRARYNWLEVADDWSQTSVWNPATRSLDPLPPA